VHAIRSKISLNSAKRHRKDKNIRHNSKHRTYLSRINVRCSK
jgi:hypothetical protein